MNRLLQPKLHNRKNKLSHAVAPTQSPLR